MRQESIEGSFTYSGTPLTFLVPPFQPIDSSTLRKIDWKNRGDGTGLSYSGAHVSGDFRCSHYIGFQLHTNYRRPI